MLVFFRGKNLLLVLVFFALGSYAQQSEEYKTKAVLIERFSRFISWPQEKDSAVNFRILVYGEHQFDNLLDIIYGDIKIKNKNVEIDYSLQLSDLVDHDMVFVGSVSRKQMEELIQLVTHKPILLIGDTDGYTEAGIHINILIEDGAIVFEMNKNRFEESGLKCNYLLFNQAKSVIQ